MDSSAYIRNSIKLGRLKKKLTQLQVSEKLGYANPMFVSLMENGRAKVPLLVLQKLIKILDLDEKKIIDVMTKEYKNKLIEKLS